MRAGRAWQEGGLRTQAGAIFERALRLVPEDPVALAGLGAALVGDPADAASDPAGRRAARGVALLSRAVERAGQAGVPTAPIEIELARAFAEALGDLPSAIAHAAAVPRDAGEFAAARALEARCRSQLGDVAGASLAYAQLREAAAAAPAAAGDRRRGQPAVATVVAWLVEAARFERHTRRDLAAAQRHLAVAVRLDPHHEEATRAFRSVGAALLEEARPAVDLPPAAREDDGDPGSSREETPAERTQDIGTVSFDGDAGVDDASPERAARVEELTRRLHADPTNDAVADELASLLEALERHHELLALMSARLEDAPAARRPELLPRFHETLERLARVAEAAGRRDEASLYRSVLANS
jgi:hypothetical protein